MSPPTPANHPRVYPAGFGVRLRQVYETASKEEVRKDLRKHFAVDPERSDQDNFNMYPKGDLWDDANLVDALVYIYNYKGLRIPTYWKNTIDEFMLTIIYGES